MPSPQNFLLSHFILLFSPSSLLSTPILSLYLFTCLSMSLSFLLSFAHTHPHRQTLCLLPLALTIKRWRRLAHATMFLIPYRYLPVDPFLADLNAEKARNVLPRSNCWNYRLYRAVRKWPWKMPRKLLKHRVNSLIGIQLMCKIVQDFKYRSAN